VITLTGRLCLAYHLPICGRRNTGQAAEYPAHHVCSRKVVFGCQLLDELSIHIALMGRFVGGGIMLGTLSSKALVRRFTVAHLPLLIHDMLLIAGAGFLYSAWQVK